MPHIKIILTGDWSSLKFSAQHPLAHFIMTPRSYPAIFIPEIQQSICQHLARRDQVQVARLSTAFTDVALNAIYKELTSLVGIFKILGEMKTPRNPDHTTGLFKDSIVPKVRSFKIAFHYKYSLSTRSSSTKRL